MMRSLYSGVSGLRTHQTRMDVIGNNIANVNTTAYKAKQMNFSDMLYQTTQAGTAANPANGTGGTNPRQIGLGVKTAAINTTITQEGANQSTGNPFDLKLTGEAFFVVSDGTSTYYTRDGSLDVDDAGNLVMASTGYIVQGWGVDENGNIVQGSLGGINVTTLDTFGADATKNAKINGILDAQDSELENKTGRTVTVGPIYDKAGYEYNAKFGILPVKNPVADSKSIANNEYEYKPEPELYKVDLSTLKYKYTIGNSTEKELKESDMPEELLEELQKDIWTVVNGGTVAGITRNTAAGTYSPGAEGDWVNVDMAAYLADASKADLNNKILGDSNLRKMAITVNFSGGIGFTTEKPSYPLSDVSAIKVNEEAVKALYTPDGTDPTKFTLKTDCASVTAIKQVYADGDKSVTEYILRGSTGPGATATDIQATGPDGQPGNAAELYAADIMKILELTKPVKQNAYTTTESKTTDQVVPKEFTISLLGITDKDGKEIDISALENGGETSWDLRYNKENGEFEYVGSEGNKSFVLSLSAIDPKFENLTIDMSNTSNVSNDKKSTLTGPRVDGRKIGTRTGVSIGTDGIVTALYSNGMARKIGQLCVATFPNAMGLENAGDNLYQMTASSGDVNIVDIKASGTGTITSGVLEMSNVDLSQQFTDMITTQRGFQANSRIITTSDTMLEELVNLKR